MNKQPKITVITAVYNLIKEGREQTFRQCVESVHSQSYKNFEQLIILTPSNDGTEELVDEYVKKGWITCHIEPQKGLWTAMQTGLKLASGDFVDIMNSDDYFNSHNAFQLIINAITLQNADYAYSDALVLSEDGSSYLWGDNYNEVPFGRGLCHQTMFVKKDVINEFGGFDVTFGNCLDNQMMLWLQLKNKKAVFINETLVTFRQGGWSSNLLLEQIKEDYQNYFYKLIGKSWDLTLEECGQIWCFNLMNDLKSQDCLELAKKIKNPKWHKVFEEKIKLRSNDETSYYYKLFNFIPIAKRVQTSELDKIKYFLFNFIPIWKITITRHGKKRSYFLFHFIPLYKVRIA